MEKVYFITLCILLQVLLAATNSERILHTCCKHQSILNPESGYCGHPSYEFANDVFPPKWGFPSPLLTQTREGYQVTFALKERAPWCRCKDSNRINVRFQKEDNIWTQVSLSLSQKTGELSNLQGAGNDVIRINDRNELLVEGHGKAYEPGQFCLNSLDEYVDSSKPSNAKLSMELIICEELCIVPSSSSEKNPDNLASSTKQSLSPLDLARTLYCGDLEENRKQWEGSTTTLNNKSGGLDTCKKWVPLYYQKDEYFSLILSYNNKTTAIKDKTYPWASLPANTYCKIRESDRYDDEETQEGGTVIKFCLSEIKELFFRYQEVYAILCGISAFFLSFNLTIYCSLKDNLSISGWTELFYSTSLYVYFVFSIVGLLIVPDTLEVKQICFGVAIITQYFELANSATLMALSLDLLITFCKFDSNEYTDDPKVSKCRLISYILFSIFFPFSIVTYGVGKNLRLWDTGRFMSDVEQLLGTPQYGLLQCTPPPWPLTSYLLFGMQGINLLFLLISAYIVINKKNNARIIRFNEDEEDHYLDPDRMDIFAKLLLFGFFFWLAGFLDFFFGGEVFTNQWNLMALRFFTYSQGISAFIIFVCNRRTLRGLMNGQWNMKGLFQHACCTCSRNRKPEGGGDIEMDEAAPLSPLMKGMNRGSIRRSTVRGSAYYR